MTRTAFIILVLAGIALAFVLPSPVPAQTPGPVPTDPIPVQVGTVTCMAHEDALRGFRVRFGEHPVWQGVGRDGRLFEMLASAETGTWSILRIDPNTDVACFMAAGDGATPLPGFAGEPS